MQSGFAIDTGNSSFSDVLNTHPYYTEIMFLEEKGIISGYPDGTFKPNQIVNRAEALKIILGATEIQGQAAMDSGSNADFKDVKDWNAWYYPYLNKATGLGIISGYPDGTFKPEQTANLVENLKILIKAKNIDVSNVAVPENPYADAFTDQWYSPYVQYGKNMEWLIADDQNRISPEQGMTRGKLAQLIYNALHSDEVSQNIKDLSKYPAKVVFLVSDEDWHSILTLIPVAVWTTSNEVTKHPLLIYHKEGNSYDIDSPSYFFDQYDGDNIIYSGNLPEQLQTLLTKQFQLIGADDPVNYWEKYTDVVYTEDNYELALMASTYASLINAPLIIQNYNSNIDLTNKNVICVGNLSSKCNENYDLDGLQKKYFEKTHTNKIILTNPKDLDIKVSENFVTEVNTNSLSQLYSGTSLAAPFLASAKHELLLTTDRTDYQSIKTFLTNKIQEFNIPAHFLTIIASPLAIQMTRPCTASAYCFEGGEQQFEEVDDNIYGRLNNSSQIDLAVGRLFGITISDVSSNIDRDLFFDELPNSNNFANLWSQRNPNGFIEAKNIDSLLESNRLLNESFYVSSDNNLDEQRDLTNKRFINYLGDGATTGWDKGISVADMRIQKIWLDASMIISQACLTSSFDKADPKSDLFATNIIRRGALLHIGGVDTTIAYDITKNIYQAMADGLSVGEALKNYKNKTSLYFKLMRTKEIPGLVSVTSIYPENEQFYILLGDPTIKANLNQAPSRITESEENNTLTIAIPQDSKDYIINTDLGDTFDYYGMSQGSSLFYQQGVSASDGNVQGWEYVYTGETQNSVNSVDKIEFIDSKNNVLVCAYSDKKEPQTNYGTLYNFSCDQGKFDISVFVNSDKKEWMMLVSEFLYPLQNLIPSYSFKVYYSE